MSRVLYGHFTSLGWLPKVDSPQPLPEWREDGGLDVSGIEKAFNQRAG